MNHTRVWVVENPDGGRPFNLDVVGSRDSVPVWWLYHEQCLITMETMFQATPTMYGTLLGQRSNPPTNISPSFSLWTGLLSFSRRVFSPSHLDLFFCTDPRRSMAGMEDGWKTCSPFWIALLCDDVVTLALVDGVEWQPFPISSACTDLLPDF